MKYKKRGFVLIVGLIAGLLLSFNFVYAEAKNLEIGLAFNTSNSVEFDYVSMSNLGFVDESININEYNPEYVYLLKLISSKKKLLHQIYFAPDFMILSDPPIELNETFVSLNLPFFADSKYIEVYYKNIKKLSVDISKQLCNKNKICDGNENYLSCPGECKFYSNDSLCLDVKDWFNISLEYWEDNYCDWDCYDDDDCFKANCNDGLKNGNETGIDCGNACFNTCKYPNKIITGMFVYEEREGFWEKIQNFFNKLI